MNFLSIQILLFLVASTLCCSDIQAQIEYGTYNLDSSKRTEVKHDKVPHRFICHLIVKRTRGTWPSTGFLLSDTFILTTGHTAGEWRKLFKNKIRSVEIVLFEHFNSTNQYQFLKKITLKRKELKGFGAHPKYSGNGTKNRPLDYGYFKLPANSLPKSDSGYFELRNYNETIDENDSLFISGYPGDMQSIKEGSLWIKGDIASSVKVSQEYITYGMYTFQGDSGAPIWIKKNNNFYVVGIHNTGFTSCNGGVKVTKALIDIVTEWMSK